MALLEDLKTRFLRQGGLTRLENRRVTYEQTLITIWEALVRAFSGIMVAVTNHNGPRLMRALETNHREFSSRVEETVLD